VPTRHLILFVKAPRLGAVKTRLAKDIGRYEAWRFYRDTERLMLRRLTGSASWRCWLVVTPDEFARQGRFWPPSIPRSGQGRGDIGERMARAFALIPPGPAVLIGADIPAVTRNHIREAFRRLAHADLVFGPSTDGGFWLIGTRRAGLTRGLFKNVRWSSPHALADTLANAKGRKVALVKPLTDIDTGENYRAWREGRLRPSDAPEGAA
jgi:rSAM/selenodomain-associated transferase 1